MDANLALTSSRAPLPATQRRLKTPSDTMRNEPVTAPEEVPTE